ncbi:MAG: hypothetical protein NVSMB42_15140 [Herpetosiphon sp.]
MVALRRVIQTMAGLVVGLLLVACGQQAGLGRPETAVPRVSAVATGVTAERVLPQLFFIEAPH